MRWLLAVAMLSLAGVALAGCSGNDEDGDASPSTSSRSQTATSASNSTTAAPNRPPSGAISVVVNGTAAAFDLTGSDPDGDALGWNLTFGDGGQANGTGLPALVNHTYATPGQFTVNFTLSDGHAPPLVYNLTANITVATAAESVVFAGHVVAPSPSYNTEGECLEAIFTEEFGTIFTVPDTTWGWTYAFDVDGMTAIFYDQGLATNLQEGPSGEVPEGAVEVIACSELAIDTDFALTLTPPA